MPAIGCPRPGSLANSPAACAARIRSSARRCQARGFLSMFLARTQFSAGTKPCPVRRDDRLIQFCYSRSGKILEQKQPTGLKCLILGRIFLHIGGSTPIPQWFSVAVDEFLERPKFAQLAWSCLPHVFIQIPLRPQPFELLEPWSPVFDVRR